MTSPLPPPPGRTIRSHTGLIAMAGLLFLIGSSIAYVLNPAWSLETQIGAGFGGVLLLGAVMLRPDAVQVALTGRSVKYGSNAVLMSLAFIGILGFINFFSLKNEQEYDLSETGLFTLSEQTIALLEGMEKPVQVMGFFQANDPRLNRAREYLERYSHYTSLLTYEFHDPNIEPALAQSFDLGNYGLVFVSGDNRYETAGVDEQTLTSGLIRVTHNRYKKIYFIIGHGEHSVDDGGPEGYATLRQALERENYGVDVLNVSTISHAIPADATALVLAGAGRDLLATEEQLIMDWITGGGKFMLLADPQEPVPMTKVLQAYGLSLGNGFVVEDYSNSLVTLGPEGLTPQVIAPLVTTYPYHEITRQLDGFQSFFPFARSITINPVNSITRRVSAIVSTSSGSWDETDSQLTQPEYNEDVDSPGPLHLGVAAEDDENGGRLVVFGNAGFVTNQNVSPQVANLDLFINAVNWLAEDEELISIRPKQPENRQLFLTPLQTSFTLFTTLVAIPLAVFAVGVGVWWKRR